MGSEELRKILTGKACYSIINSLVLVEKQVPGGLYDSRLSNGPIESLNRNAGIYLR